MTTAHRDHRGRFVSADEHVVEALVLAEKGRVQRRAGGGS